jgi:hypothetical protein
MRLLGEKNKEHYPEITGEGLNPGETILSEPAQKDSIEEIAMVKQTLKAKEEDMSNSLLSFTGCIEDAQVQILADTGALGRYLNAKVVKRLGLKIEEPDQSISIEAAGGYPLHFLGTVKIGLKIGEFSEVADFKVLPLGDATDIILGRKFFTRYKANIDYRKGGLNFKIPGQRKKIYIASNTQVKEKEEKPDIINLLMDSKNARRQIRKHRDHVLWIVREEEMILILPTDGKRESCTKDYIFSVTEDSVIAKSITGIKELDDILGKLLYILGEELPNRLPPRRKIEHGITVEHGVPKNLAAYHLSHSQLMEQRKQILELLEKGLVQPSSSPWGAPVLFVAKS